MDERCLNERRSENIDFQGDNAPTGEKWASARRAGIAFDIRARRPRSATLFFLADDDQVIRVDQAHPVLDLHVVGRLDLPAGGEMHVQDEFLLRLVEPGVDEPVVDVETLHLVFIDLDVLEAVLDEIVHKEAFREGPTGFLVLEHFRVPVDDGLILARRDPFGDDQFALALELVVATQKRPVEVVQDVMEDHAPDDLVEQPVVEQAVGNVPFHHGDAFPRALLEHRIGEVHPDDVPDVRADRAGHGARSRADVQDEIVLREPGRLDDLLDVPRVLRPKKLVVIPGPDVPKVPIGHGEISSQAPM